VQEKTGIIRIPSREGGLSVHFPMFSVGGSGIAHLRGQENSNAPGGITRTRMEIQSSWVGVSLPRRIRRAIRDHSTSPLWRRDRHGWFTGKVTSGANKPG